MFSLVSLALPGKGTSRAQVLVLLPEIESWGQSEEAQRFFPENLFEYINGAAEIYLSYDFHELLVAQYQKNDSPASVSVEIYDMGSPVNSFGIYSAERYPENNFMPLGVQGYLEEGTLNFLVGRYYIKLLCFDCEETSGDTLKAFAEGILGRVEDKGDFPALLNAFPHRGRLANSEKYILSNVMGYAFLHDGFLVNYQAQGQSFDCFVIVGKDTTDAESMLKSYLEAKEHSSFQPKLNAHLIQDKYYHNIYFAQVDRYLCGVMKIKPGFEKLGEGYLSELMNNLKQQRP
jgi:hypothetical protein